MLPISIRARRLHAGLVFAEEIAPLEPSESAVGIDLGVNSILALSDGALARGPDPGPAQEPHGATTTHTRRRALHPPPEQACDVTVRVRGCLMGTQGQRGNSGG